jgi:hypothetical protein
VGITAPSAIETPTQTPLADIDRTQTQAAAELQVYIETQLATLGMPSVTPTFCVGGPCATPTSTRTPYRSPTPTLTRTPGPPDLSLHINRPGPLSKVTSPILLEATGYTGVNGTFNVDLLGEDGRPIFRQVVRASIIADDFERIFLKINFQIPGVAEAARLQVSTEDFYNRPVSLTSVDLILLSLGEDQLNPQDDGLDPFVIMQPKINETVSGGTVTISGMARPINGSPIILELFTQEGNLIGTRQVSLPPGKGFLPFKVEITYTVSQIRNIRLVIRQSGKRISGTAALSSMVFQVKP